MLKSVFAFLAFIALIASWATACAAPPGATAIAVHVDREGNTFSVNAQWTVAASVDEVWEVLTDFDRMAQILSNVDASRIANREGDRFDVIQKSHASAGLMRISLDSVRRVELTPKRQIQSHVIKGDVKSSDFTTRIAEEAGGLVRVTVSGHFVPSALGGATITPELVQTQTQRQYQELRDEILRRKTNEPPPPCLLAKNCTRAAG